jgi:hypothetical protein
MHGYILNGCPLEANDLIQLLNGSGNVALCVCTFFIYKASERLARIEKALERYMTENSK